jgi:putative sterol carrier protein
MAETPGSEPEQIGPEAAGAGTVPATSTSDGTAPSSAGGGGTTSPQDLAALLEGRSDEEINAFVKDAGSEGLMDAIFSGMAERFLPEKAAGKTAVIQYDITTPDGVESRQVIVKDGTCNTTRGAGEPASVTLSLTMPDFLRLISGKLNGVQAFMSGKLKLKGDMMLAQSMQSWFDQS